MAELESQSKYLIEILTWMDEHPGEPYWYRIDVNSTHHNSYLKQIVKVIKRLVREGILYQSDEERIDGVYLKKYFKINES